MQNIWKYIFDKKAFQFKIIKNTFLTKSLFSVGAAQLRMGGFWLLLMLAAKVLFLEEFLPFSVFFGCTGISYFLFLFFLYILIVCLLLSLMLVAFQYINYHSPLDKQLWTIFHPLLSTKLCEIQESFSGSSYASFCRASTGGRGWFLLRFIFVLSVLGIRKVLL